MYYSIIDNMEVPIKIKYMTNTGLYYDVGYYIEQLNRIEASIREIMDKEEVSKEVKDKLREIIKMINE